MASQARQIGGGNNSQIQILSEMVRDAIKTVNPCRAHRTRLCLFFAEHEVIDDHRPIRAREKLAESNLLDRCVSCIEFPGNLLEYVILDRRTLGELAAQLRDPFSLLPQIDFGAAQFVSLREVFLRLVRQTQQVTPARIARIVKETQGQGFADGSDPTAAMYNGSSWR